MSFQYSTHLRSEIQISKPRSEVSIKSALVKEPSKIRMPKLHKSFPITLTNKKSIKIIISMTLHYFPKIFHVKHFLKYNNHKISIHQQLRAKPQKEKPRTIYHVIIPLKHFIKKIFLYRTITMRTLIKLKRETTITWASNFFALNTIPLKYSVQNIFLNRTPTSPNFDYQEKNKIHLFKK